MQCIKGLQCLIFVFSGKSKCRKQINRSSQEVREGKSSKVPIAAAGHCSRLEFITLVRVTAAIVGYPLSTYIQLLHSSNI